MPKSLSASSLEEWEEPSCESVSEIETNGRHLLPYVVEPEDAEVLRQEMRDLQAAVLRQFRQVTRPIPTPEFRVRFGKRRSRAPCKSQESPMQQRGIRYWPCRRTAPSATIGSARKGNQKSQIVIAGRNFAAGHQQISKASPSADPMIDPAITMNSGSEGMSKSDKTANFRRDVMISPGSYGKLVNITKRDIWTGGRYKDDIEFVAPTGRQESDPNGTSKLIEL